MSEAPLQPGAKVGIVGGGQLGRMLAAAAQRLGYKPHVLAPEARPPAAAFASRHLRAEFDDVAALTALASAVDVITFEFENVSSEALAAAAAVCAVRPSPAVLDLTQDRAREKGFLRRHGLPHVANRLVPSREGLAEAVAAIGTPCVVKTAGFGYDGKGQRVIAGNDDLAGWQAAEALAATGPAVVERFVELRLELSVVGARGPGGQMRVYAPIINRHVDHILDVSVTPHLYPAAEDAYADANADANEDVEEAADAQAGAIALRLPASVAAEAEDLTRDVMRHLELVGLCCVEFFLTRDGTLLVNEIAPRPHNSGHLTIEAAATSQFEQQLRAVCGLPLGSTALFSPAAMANLLGGLWSAGAPNFAAALATEAVSLHLYGKSEPRPGRKMGHLTALANEPAQAVARVLAARDALRPSPPALGSS
ncbi:MAG TPA: 5-(carboxyamino)imidazole ribonucleotide synthase [Trueperaceae bacterium]|nr:5-(carboxyamino)imidazole ribonucleotide synthase [Trueperaceae bacterium]